MELELSGKVAVVTGASRSIGAVIAGELAKEGCIFFSSQEIRASFGMSSTVL